MFTCLAIVLGLFVTLPVGIAFGGTIREIETLRRIGAASSRVNNARLRSMTLQAMLAYMILMTIVALVYEWMPAIVADDYNRIDPPVWLIGLGRVGFTLIPAGAFAVFILYVYPRSFDKYLTTLPRSRVLNYALVVLNFAMSCDLIWTRGINP